APPTSVPRSGVSGDDTGPAPVSAAPPLDVVLADFTARWKRGESPRVEDYLGRLDPGRPEDLVELICHEVDLAELAGLKPNWDEYYQRFPQVRELLERQAQVDMVLTSSVLRDIEGVDGNRLPEVGDEIGPYRLVRELGRGAF